MAAEANAYSSMSAISMDLKAPAASIARAKQIIRAEANALQHLQAGLDESFSDAVQALANCRGRVVVTGIGKAGIVGQKFAASLSSTGTPSFFLHPSEAVHGDMGSVQPEDCIVFFSYSGEAEEVNRLLPILPGEISEGNAGNDNSAFRRSTIAITKNTSSTLGRRCEFVVPIGKHEEACTHGLAPTTSTTLMLAISDALALVASELKGFTKRDFGRFHPAGSLGRQLMRVTEAMRPLEDCRVAPADMSVRDVLVLINRPGRRTGAIMLTNPAGELVGLFTDSDLARLLEQQKDAFLDRPIREIMADDFHTVAQGDDLKIAVDLISTYKISEVPVVDDNHRPIGIVDITDVVDLQLTPAPAPSSAPASEEQTSTGATGDVGVPRILSLIKFQQGAER
ncbi:MAG: KpsF/GutQ family sugar-phosphate isomerase [Planctomycetota bacterium]